MQAVACSPIILYDGVCGLCNRLVQFVLARDRRDHFRFASLQSPFAAEILQRFGANAADLDTVYVVIDYDRPTQRLVRRSDAIIFVLRQLGGVWTFVWFLLRLIPHPLREWGYKLVAHYRYRIFGKYDVCPLPREKDRRKFLDLA